MKKDKEKKPVYSCKTCKHEKEPAKSEVCLDCWRYHRWKNWEAKENGET